MKKCDQNLYQVQENLLYINLHITETNQRIYEYNQIQQLEWKTLYKQ